MGAMTGGHGWGLELGLGVLVLGGYVWGLRLAGGYDCELMLGL